jgi:uncharacterized protein YjbI with pentapeptide repeats
VASISAGLLALGLILTAVIAVAGTGVAMWLEDRITSHQQVLENARFVRQVAFDTDATVQPFAGLTLTGAQLSGLDLSCRVLGPSARNFYGARAFYAFKPGSPCADLFGSDLSGALLREADLSGADLREADLSGADLTDAILISANPIAADLSEAVLTGADLSDANLIRADLSGAVLTGANLSEALLFDADLSDAGLSEVCFDVNTQWPQEFDPPADPDCSDWL